MRRARCLSCESLDSSSGLTWPLPLAELSAWSVWKVSADLAGTVSCLGGGSSSVRDGTKDLVYARTSFQTCIWKAQSGVRGKFTIQGHKGSCAGGTRSGKREGRMEIAATRRSPRASHMPSGGGGQGRASQGTSFADPKRVSFLTQLVTLWPLEIVKGRTGTVGRVADRWPTFECHFHVVRGDMKAIGV